MSDTNTTTFFGKDGLHPFIGKIVKFDAQKNLVQGQSWGWRYKVRMIGDFSEKDSVDDAQVYTASTLLPPTSGTGGGGRTSTVKLVQGDMVFGLFLAPNKGFPVILAAFPRTKDTKDTGGKFGINSGFFGKLLKGLTEGQEYSGQDQMVTPKVREQGEKGGGKTKAVPEEKLGDIKDGQNSDENAVDALPEPKTPLLRSAFEFFTGQELEKDVPMKDAIVNQLEKNFPNISNIPGTLKGIANDEEIQKKIGYQAGKLKKIGDEFLKSNEVKNIRNDLEILFSNPNAKGNPLGLGNPLIDPKDAAKDKEQKRLDKILDNENANWRSNYSSYEATGNVVDDNAEPQDIHSIANGSVISFISYAHGLLDTYRTKFNALKYFEQNPNDPTIGGRYNANQGPTLVVRHFNTAKKKLIRMRDENPKVIAAMSSSARNFINSL